MKKPPVHFSLITVCFFVILLSCTRQMAEGLQVKGLRTEMIFNPEGIDVRNPGLSWEISGADRGIEQTGFQVLVSSSPE